MKKRIVVISVIMLIVVILLVLINNNIVKIGDNIFENNKVLGNDKFELSLPENDQIMVTISRENGIDKIEYPNGFIVYGKGKNKIAIDFEIESQKEYTFKTTDSNGNVTYDTFITPIMHIELTKNDVSVNLEDQKQNIETRVVS